MSATVSSSFIAMRLKSRDVDGGSNGIRLAVRPIRIHIDETHLHGGERISSCGRRCSARRYEDPGTNRLLAPVDGFVRLPHIGAPPPKPNVLKPIDSSATFAARIMRSAGDFPAIFLLDRPQSRRALSSLHCPAKS